MNKIDVLMIPAFDPETGYLPPGVHDATWREVVARYGFNPYRSRLLDGLLAALRNLRRAGCISALIDGSFVTAKRFPGDYDGTWDPSGVDPALVDPVLLTFENKRAAMKAKYLGELFPANGCAAPGVAFAEFFQRDRDGVAKGVVRLGLRELP